MRALGYRTVDLLVDAITDPDAPPLRRAAPDELRARLGGPPPEEGEPVGRGLERPAGADHRLRPAAGAAAMDADARAGLQPLFVVASAGSTNLGVVDPLGDLAEVCRERGAWLHANAAYGGFAVLTERGRRALAG